MHWGGKTKEAGTKAWGRPFWTMLQSVCVTLPLGGCLLAGDKPEPGLSIPAAYSAGPRNPAAAEASNAAARLVARFPLARAHRDH